MDYEKKYKEALERAKKEAIDGYLDAIAIDTIFPELAESEDEKIRKALIDGFTVMKESKNCGKTFSNHNIPVVDILAWLEKQGKQSICKTPSREIILAIWDLGNEWKELTNGCISTEYGTQLDYIQKHWHESEYYLRAKQGEQKPAWSEEDQNALEDIREAVVHYWGGDTQDILLYWLKSIKQRIGGEQ